jgi:hypothetical protein
VSAEAVGLICRARLLQVALYTGKKGQLCILGLCGASIGNVALASSYVSLFKERSTLFIHNLLSQLFAFELPYRKWILPD